MRSNHVIVLLFMIWNNSNAGESYIVYMGGGGDPKNKKDTIFDIDLLNASNFLNRSKNVDIIYNGGHEDTEKYLKNRFVKKEVKYFNQANFYMTIDKYKNLISTGKIKSGDKILLTIDTHGASNSTKSEFTHQIATGTAHDGSENVSVDKLSSLIELAKSKGVKLAVADLSCHSGNALKLANPKTCIISATGENHYSFKGQETFSAKFFAGLAPGKNLEDIFLQARSSAVDRSFPMISSPAGRFTSKSIYEGFTPFLYSKNDDGKGSDSVDHYLFNSSRKEAFCKNQNQFSHLLKMIEQIEKDEKTTFEIFNFQLSFNDAEFSNLKKMLKKVNNDYSSIITDYQKYKDKLKGRVKVNYKTADNISQSLDYSLEEIISTNFEALLSKEKNKVGGMPVLMNLFTSLIAKQKELLAADKGLISIQKKIELLGNRVKDSAKNSAFIAREEKKIYHKIYEKYSKGDLQPNPCKDFVI